jgi:hypothetical protein
VFFISLSLRSFTVLFIPAAFRASKKKYKLKSKIIFPHGFQKKKLCQPLFRGEVVKRKFYGNYDVKIFLTVAVSGWYHQIILRSFSQMTKPNL